MHQMVFRVRGETETGPMFPPGFNSVHTSLIYQISSKKFTLDSKKEDHCQQTAKEYLIQQHSFKISYLILVVIKANFILLIQVIHYSLSSKLTLMSDGL